MADGKKHREANELDEETKKRIRDRLEKGHELKKVLKEELSKKKAN